MNGAIKVPGCKDLNTKLFHLTALRSHNIQFPVSMNNFLRLSTHWLQSNRKYFRYSYAGRKEGGGGSEGDRLLKRHYHGSKLIYSITFSNRCEGILTALVQIWKTAEVRMISPRKVISPKSHSTLSEY